MIGAETGIRPPHPPHRPGRTTPIVDAPALCRLLAWLSPAFPVGGYSYSHGLEAAVEAGLVANADDLGDWLTTVMTSGGARIDAILLAEAWRAEATGDSNRAEIAAILADACRATAELALESRAQGQAFLDAVAAGWRHPAIERYQALLDRIDRPPAYACAVGVAAAAAAIPLDAALVAWLQTFAANGVSAGVKLIPLGQRAGLAALARLEPVVLAVAAEAAALSPAEIAASALIADWASAAHETLYTRLFRS
jgi:urease accessory protein